MISSAAKEPEVGLKPVRASVGRLQRVSGLILVVLLTAWTLHLLPQWLRNPDLSHGLFAPLVFAFLLHEARSRGTQRYLRSSLSSTALIGVIGASSLVLLGTAGLYAAALEWTHSLVEFLLAAALCALLTASWLTASLDRVKLVPFNWPAAVAVLVWALSAPVPPGTYTRLTQQLQSQVTTGVLFSLNLFGIAASQDGNVIDLAHTRVGVEEACSGVRSLLSCIFAGFFLSAVLSRGFWRRAAIVALAGPLAIAMNFIRSLLLTLLANAGVDIRGSWHDLTGFGILAATAVLLAGTAVLLERLNGKQERERREPLDTSSSECPEQFQPTRDPSPSVPRAATASEWLVFTSLLIALGTLGLFIEHTRPSHHRTEKTPDLWAMLPEAPENWEVTNRADLYRFSSQLQTDILAERTYVRQDERGSLQITVYLAYWPPGQASVSLVAAHTPDACWPGSGWVEDRDQHRTLSLTIDDTRLPIAQFRSFKLDSFPQRVWYWHLFDRKPIEGTVGTPRQLLSLAWNYGFRDEEEQVFARISSNRTWEEIAREPLVKEIVARLKPMGL